VREKLRKRAIFAPDCRTRFRRGMCANGAKRTLAERRVMTKADIRYLPECLVLRSLPSTIGAKTLFIEPGSPWENGYCERFHGKLRDELLDGEIFFSLKEPKSSSSSGITTKHARPTSHPAKRNPHAMESASLQEVAKGVYHGQSLREVLRGS
jgi:transposase InsO family protein